MTDNEIIKELNLRIDDFSRETLDLINRQKAKIERLKSEIEEVNEADRETEIQALKESKENAKLFCEAINHAKSEAMKKLAERLKEEIISDTAYGCDCNQHSGYYDYTIKIGDIPEYIDDIVKKLTEVRSK